MSSEREQLRWQRDWTQPRKEREQRERDRIEASRLSAERRWMRSDTEPR